MLPVVVRADPKKTEFRATAINTSATHTPTARQGCRAHPLAIRSSMEVDETMFPSPLWLRAVHNGT